MKILVIGASRGIGLELVRQYRDEDHAVTATARDEAGLQRLHALGASALILDVADAQSCSRLSWALEGERFDIAIHSAGVYGPRLREFETPSQADFDHVMHTNVLGPMRVLPLLVDAIAPGARIVLLTSRMGSIGLRTGAAGSLYRASKAAANSVLKDAAIILGSRAVCVAMHPGWVRTDMGGEGADLDVADSAAGIRRTIARLGAADNGQFFDYDGSPLAW
jgi:NAD(P)-dependent dehydrogenase (short-subunit alcohol dehydrogenase family)